jgi:hypothetical protein
VARLGLKDHRQLEAVIAEVAGLDGDDTDIMIGAPGLR